jgi:hypothetical protein
LLLTKWSGDESRQGVIGTCGHSQEKESIMKLVLFAGSVLLSLALVGFSPQVAAQTVGSHTDLLNLFEEFNEFRDQRVSRDASVDIAAAMDKKYHELKRFQSRLAAIDSSNWPISEQIDYQLTRAQMNGMEFELRVVKPWRRNPGYYGGRRGGLGRIPRMPLEGNRVAEFQSRLQSVPEYFEQAKRNLGGGDVSEIAGDLAILAIRNLERSETSFPELLAQLGEHHPDLVADAKRAQVATEGYLRWLKENQAKMTASAGVGKENYNWLLTGCSRTSISSLTHGMMYVRLWSLKTIASEHSSVLKKTEIVIFPHSNRPHPRKNTSRESKRPLSTS